MADRRIEVPTYGPDAHLIFEWDDGFQIIVDRTNSEVSIKANAAGLVSLARHCLTLAQESVPPGSHIHLTDSVELEVGSGDLIVEKLAD